MKLNPAHAIFDDNMFAKLHVILEPIAPHPSLPTLDMSIGEPQMPPCQLLLDSVAKHNSAWQFYPKATGNARFIGAVQNYIDWRWPVASQVADDAQIIPVPGTREALHFLGYLVSGTKPNAVALVTNPFYHAWRAGALASGGEIRFLNSGVNHNFLPDLQAIDEDILARTTILYLCSPTNPHGSIMGIDYLKMALSLARQHNFLLVMDECYCDIWQRHPPPGIIEAAAVLAADEPGLDPLRNLVVLNSLSKRSGAAGWRAGFMVGEKNVIVQYLKLVSNGGSLVPTPLLEVAADLYDDDDHVAMIRSFYNANFDIAATHLQVTPAEGGFFLWLKVDDDIEFVQYLMAKKAVCALPGSFMAVTTNVGNPGRGYVRLALVHDADRTDTAIRRIAEIYQQPDQREGFRIRWQ